MARVCLAAAAGEAQRAGGRPHPGVMWALWHIPAYLIPWSSQHLPLLPYLLHFAALSVLFTWVYNNTGGSLLPVLLLHTSVNLFTAFLPGVRSAAGSEWPLDLMVALLYVTAAVVGIVLGPNRAGDAYRKFDLAAGPMDFIR